MIRNWITLESFKSLFPIRISMCETKRMLGREERNLCHHLSLVTRWCSSTTVMLWSCSYATWRTDLAVGLFISLCVCFVAVSVHSETQPHQCWTQACLGSGSWPPHGHMGMELSDSPRHENISWARMSHVYLELCSRFLCVAEIGFTWVGGQPASADFLIKLKRERGQKRQRLYWSLIE